MAFGTLAKTQPTMSSFAASTVSLHLRSHARRNSCCICCSSMHVLRAQNVDILWEGFVTGGCVFAGAALLELSCLSTVRSILRKDRELYTTAWMYNIINHLCVAPIVYLVGVRMFASPAPRTLLAHTLYTIGVVCIHSAGYYCTHRAMHTKALYWAHRYHHRFNTYICPIAASAVTQVEYLFAYLIPFIIAGVILQPLPLPTIAIAGLIIGHVNNLIHTPWVEDLSERLVPWFGVSTADHFAHHRKLTTNYAAPTLNIDALVRLSPTLEAAATRLFLAVFGKPVAVQSDSSHKKM